MKIAIAGPIWLNIPPDGYGGTEEVVYNLSEGLVDKGQDVTLFGPGTSKVRANLVPTIEKPLRSQDIEWENVTYTIIHMDQVFQRKDFDIIHAHINKSQDYIALALAARSSLPVLSTLHFKLPSPEEHKDRYDALMHFRNLPFTSISNSQRANMPLNFIATTYNGIKIENFPFNPQPEDYFVWLGKVNPVKGAKEAILAAKKAGVRLMVLGAVDKGVPHMLAYYEEEIKPLIDDEQIIWVGEVSIEEKARILGGAKGFLNPILWEEPYGLVMAESQATGTPVISFRRGAAPELIKDGQTGYLVEDVDEMAQKIKLIDKIDRSACRRNIEENFSTQRMTEQYLLAYQKCIDNWPSYLKK